jgi:hypothetical protein
MAGLIGCGGASEIASGEPDARPFRDAEVSTGGEGLDATLSDADATLPFEGAAPDSGSEDATLLQDATLPQDSAFGDVDEDSQDVRSLDAGDGALVDAGTPLDGASDATREGEVAEDAEAAADGLPSTAPCLTGGHVLSVEGDPGSFFFTGTQTDALGSVWAVEAEEYYAVFDGALIEVEPPPSADAGGSWFLDFNTWNAMIPMKTGVVYDIATVSNSISFGYTRTCSSAAGSFRVDEMEAPDASVGGVSMLLGFTAAFAITCDGYPGALRGCVHF